MSVPDLVGQEQWLTGRRQADHVAYERYRASNDFGETCGLCGRALAKTELAWRAIVKHGDGIRRMTTMCETCADPVGATWTKEEPCEACGRFITIVYYDWLAHKHIFCCERCVYRWYNRQRSDRSRQARERICPVCEQSFVGSRRDAVTCSPACRQKFYRLRKKAQ